MTEKRVENIATHRQKLADVVRHLKSESVVQFRTESAYAQAIIWASERLAELETLEEATDDESRSLFFCLGNGIEITPHGYCEAVAWGQNHIRHLEQLAKDIGEVLEQREKCLLQMHSYLRDRNETIYELKAEIKRLRELTPSIPTNLESDTENRDVFFSLGTSHEEIAINHCEAIAWGQGRVRQLECENENLSKTVSAMCQSWHLPACAIEEEQYQRRRRERMLDEVTLICVRDGIERMKSCATAEHHWGRNARDTAENICDGINEFDAKH